MPRLTPQRREAQRQRIVDAARTAMLRDGLQATSMARVIEESGLSAGAIYGYFASKDELVVAVAVEVIRTRLASMAALAEERPVPHPTAALGAFVGQLPQGREAALVLDIWASAAHHEALRERTGAVFAEVSQGALTYLEAWFTHGRGLTPAAAATEARRALPALLALGQGFIVQSTLLGTPSPEDFRAAVEALWPTPEETPDGE